MDKNWPMVPLGEVLTPIIRPEIIDPSKTYRILGAHWYAKGLYVKDTRLGSQIRADKVYKVKQGDFVYNRLFAWKGSFAVATQDDHGCYVSNEFPCFTINTKHLDPRYLLRYFSRNAVWEEALGLSSGGTPTSRNRLKEGKLLAMFIPLPSVLEQKRIADFIDLLEVRVNEANGLRCQCVNEVNALLSAAVGRILGDPGKQAGWEFGPLADFAEINPSRKGKINLALEDMVSFIPMRAIDDVAGTIKWPEIRKFIDVSKGYTWFQDRDVIFARITPCMQNGKIAIARNLVNGVGFGSTEFHVIRPGSKVISEWIYILMRHKAFRDDAAAHFKGTAGQQRVPQGFLDQKAIPVPSIPEQQRIVAYLGHLQAKADALKKLQQEVVAELDVLLPSILNKAFNGEL